MALFGAPEDVSSVIVPGLFMPVSAWNGRRRTSALSIITPGKSSESVVTYSVAPRLRLNQDTMVYARVRAAIARVVRTCSCRAPSRKPVQT